MTYREGDALVQEVTLVNFSNGRWRLYGETGYENPRAGWAPEDADAWLRWTGTDLLVYKQEVLPTKF